MLMIGLGGDPYKIHHEGYYEDTYVKTPKGWRFKSRIHHVPEGGTTGQGQGQGRGGQQGQVPNAAPAAPAQERKTNPARTPQPRTPNPEPERAPNPESRIPNPESRIPGPGPRDDPL